MMDGWYLPHHKEQDLSDEETISTFWGVGVTVYGWSRTGRYLYSTSTRVTYVDAVCEGVLPRKIPKSHLPPPFPPLPPSGWERNSIVFPRPSLTLVSFHPYPSLDIGILFLCLLSSPVPYRKHSFCFSCFLVETIQGWLLQY